MTPDRLGVMTPEERFWAKVDKSEGCWVWAGQVDRNGYGVLQIRSRASRMVRAHRYAYELAHGPIEPDLFICHRCDNPPCVNPAHLFAGSASDNNYDASRKGRHPQGRKTHCKRGHEFTPENTYIKKHGWRQCRACLKRGKSGRAESGSAGEAAVAG